MSVRAVAALLPLTQGRSLTRGQTVPQSSLRSGVRERERDLLRREGEGELELPALRSVSWGVLGGERERERERPL